MDAAHDWGMRPSALGICEPQEDAALMVAYSQARSKVASIENERNRRKSGQ